jgi:hypothetical protein
MGGGADATGMNLLRRADVATELKLTDDQKTKIQALQTQMQQDRRAAMQDAGDDQDARAKAMTKVTEGAQKQLGTILNADQTKRLHELNIQRAKNSAITFADVQKDLALTDDQKAKIKDLQQKQMAAMREMFQNGGQGGDREAMQANMKKMQDTMDVELGKILTDDQKTKLKAMGGTAFTFKDAPAGGGGR